MGSDPSSAQRCSCKGWSEGSDPACQRDDCGCIDKADHPISAVANNHASGRDARHDRPHAVCQDLGRPRGRRPRRQCLPAARRPASAARSGRLARLARPEAPRHPRAQPAPDVRHARSRHLQCARPRRHIQDRHGAARGAARRDEASRHPPLRHRRARPGHRARDGAGARLEPARLPHRLRRQPHLHARRHGGAGLRRRLERAGARAGDPDAWCSAGPRPCASTSRARWRRA